MRGDAAGVILALVSSSLRSVTWVRVEIQGKGRERKLEVGGGQMSTILI
jgi:hypothetical protein